MRTHSISGNEITNQVLPPSVNLEEATSLIIKRAKKLVNELVKRRGREKPPFLAEEYAPLQGIKEIVKTDLGELSALLVRSVDGYVMKVNANHHPVRQNFSCAHEIGHTFLHELELQHSTDNAEFRLLGPDIHDRAKERLCDVAAAELLMPEPVFKKYLSGFGLLVNSVERLAYNFKVSITAAAMRIAEVSPEPCIAIQWKRWQRSRSEGFHLAWARGPGRMWRNKARQTYVRDPSTLLRAYESDSFAKSFKSFEIGNIRKRCYMESKGFGRNENRYVISLVFPER